MLTLQKKIIYQGKINQAPVTHVRLSAIFPQFDYVDSGADSHSIERRLISSTVSESKHVLTEKEYRISASISNLIGSSSKSIVNFLAYTSRSTASKAIQSLQLSVPIQILANSTLLSETVFDAIYFISDIEALLRRSNIYTHVLSPSLPLSEMEPVRSFLETNVHLVNKDAYFRFLPLFKRLIRRDDDFILLAILSSFVEKANLDPSTPRKWGQPLRALLGEVLNGMRVTPGDVIPFIEKSFNEFFEFPLAVPQIDTLEVGGVFEVKTSDNSTITTTDLSLYNLSLEYPTRSADGRPSFHHVTYQWENTIPVQKNRVPFSFLGGEPVIRNSLSGPVNISVKSFDGVVLWNRDYQPDDVVLKKIEIVVERVRPVTRSLGHAAGVMNPQKKLRGQVLEFTKKCPLKDMTVVIQAKNVGEELWRVVAAATTDASGQFSMPYPYGKYAKAQAIVSLAPNRPADISIRNSGGERETIADDFLYLLVTQPTCPEVRKKEDCDCNEPKKAPRLPDQADLVGSDDYTQDIGGSCLNLSTPNRTLSEYGFRAIVRTSDPDVANYTLEKNEDGSFVLKGGQKTIRRSPVSLDNPIRWQDAPDANKNLTLYQAVSVATGHVLHYKAVFKADGYSLGELLYSLALAPGQKKQIVVFDSAHSLHAAESQSLSQVERLTASLLNEGSIIDHVSGNLNEAMRGNSAASTGGVSAGLGAGGTNGSVSGVLGIGGGYSTSSASASQNSSRDTAMFFFEKLSQQIRQNAQSYRQQNTSVVHAVQQGQQYAATTEVVANHNHCHALTMMYFEVLRHYAIFQELANVEECIFVPLLMTYFSPENIYKWSDILARSLLPLPSNTYLQPFSFLRYRVQHPLIPAFDANERRRTNYKHVDFPDGAFCHEPITSITGYVTLRVNIPRPKTIYDRIMSFPIVKKEVIVDKQTVNVDVLGLPVYSGSSNTTVTKEMKEAFANEHLRIYANIDEAQPADVIEVIKFDKFFVDSKDERLWSVVATLCGYDNVEKFLANYFAHKTISKWDATFNDEIAPAVFEALVDNTISIWPFSALDLTTVDKYHGGEQLMRLNFRADTSLARKEISSVAIVYLDKVSIPAFWHFVTFQVENLCVNYTTKHYEGFIVNRAISDTLYDNTDVTKHPIQSPMNSDEQRNPRQEDEYLVLKLLEHLNSNIEYYNRMLWHHLDVERRYMLLDGFGIQVYNDQGVSLGMRSLASVVRNELVTITGNSLVFPVAAGYRVSQSYIVELGPRGEAQAVSLLDHYKPLTPTPPYRISVPSRGVFLEAVQGACDACERVKENSSQDWNKFTTDEPTPVLPVTPPVATVIDWKAAFKDFAPPLVSIQNAPAAPAPGAGLAGVTELLGKSDIFKNITGLDTTQQNAIRTYLSNQDNAKAFAAMAKDLAMQEHNTQHSDKITDALKAAQSSGAISAEDASDLTKRHVQQMIDGGATRRITDQSTAASEKPSLSEAAIKAGVDQNRAVKVQSNDPVTGKTEMVDLSAGGKALQYDFRVPGTLTPLMQPTPMACWATVAAIILNWKNKTSKSPQQTIDDLAPEFTKYIVPGLPIDQINALNQALGFVAVPSNVELPTSVYYDLLQQHGPVWIIDLESSDPTAVHGRVLVGIKGDDNSASTMFTMIDPASGTQYDEPLADFVRKTEAVVATLDALADARIPLAIYLKDTYQNSAYVGGRRPNLPPTKTPGKILNDFRPANNNTIVVNMKEFHYGGMNFTNFKDCDTNPQQIHHNPTPRDPVRVPGEVKQIVLHETGMAAGGAFALPFTAHMAVLRDNTVSQFNDLIETESHASGFNDHSIGIEFANLAWDQGAASRKDKLLAKYKDATKYLPAYWGEGCNVYTLPAVDQLEALVELIQWLTAFNSPPEPGSALPNFPRTWLQLVSYDDVSPIWKFDADDVPATSAGKAERKFFICTRAYGFMTKAARGNTPGILCHHNIARDAGFITRKDHADGAIPSLYVYLRTERGLDAATAYGRMKFLAVGGFIKATTKKAIPRFSDEKTQSAGEKPIDNRPRQIVLVDVTKIPPP
jgi:hypothetical protein